MHLHFLFCQISFAYFVLICKDCYISFFFFFWIVTYLMSVCKCALFQITVTIVVVSSQIYIRKPVQGIVWIVGGMSWEWFSCWDHLPPCPLPKDLFCWDLGFIFSVFRNVSYFDLTLIVSCFGFYFWSNTYLYYNSNIYSNIILM